MGMMLSFAGHFCLHKFKPPDICYINNHVDSNHLMAQKVSKEIGEHKQYSHHYPPIDCHCECSPFSELSSMAPLYEKEYTATILTQVRNYLLENSTCMPKSSWISLIRYFTWRDLCIYPYILVHHSLVSFGIVTLYCSTYIQIQLFILGWLHYIVVNNYYCTYLMKVQPNRSWEHVNTETMAKKVPKLKAEKRQQES